MQKEYTAQDKMCDLINAEYQALQIISRFGLPLGVGDKTIQEFCEEHQVHTLTFLAVVNFQYGMQPESSQLEALSLHTLLSYLRNAHSYFFDFSLPMIRKKLIEAMNYADAESKIPMLIIRFFDEYVNEIYIHMQHENEQMFPYVEALLNGEHPEVTIEMFAHQHRAIDDQHIANKLLELKNLIIKYYPEKEQNNLLNSALYDILAIEQELASHCAIEDCILLPAVRLIEKKRPRKVLPKPQQVEPLSDREKDVLVELVGGKSNKEIADVLNISTNTVITHRKNISRKLNIHSVAGLTIYAIVNNLVDISKLQ
jgi:regulator of cell morphogenesis and NO signaling